MYILSLSMSQFVIVFEPLTKITTFNLTTVFTGINLSKRENKVCKVMVHNPIYEGDGPVYESVQTQLEMNSVTESNMPQSVVTTSGQNITFNQSLSDTARYIDRPPQLQQYLYTNSTSDGSDTGTPTDTPTSETVPLTTSRVMALKKNRQERNKLHLTLSLGGNDSSNNPTMANEIAPESVGKTNAFTTGNADELYIEMSPAGAQ